MTTTTLSSKFQIVIPREIRKEKKLKANDKFVVLTLPGSDSIIIKPIKPNMAKHYRGIAKDVFSKINVDDYIKDARASWEK